MALGLGKKGRGSGPGALNACQGLAGGGWCKEAGLAIVEKTGKWIQLLLQEGVAAIPGAELK